MIATGLASGRDWQRGSEAAGDGLAFGEGEGLPTGPGPGTD